jgi:integrase
MATSKPSIGDFSHLFDDDSPVRKAITMDYERGYFHADTPEESQTMATAMESYSRLQQGRLSQAVSQLPSSKSNVNLETAKEQYFTERAATLKKSTLAKHKGALRAFIESVGNIDVAMVDHKSVNDYKQKKLAAGNHPVTINDHMTILRGFFDYCIKNRIAKMENPAKDVNIVGADNKSESYMPFTLVELKRIFNPLLYCKWMGKKPDFYWGPLLGMFTGARAEELASLDLSQIEHVHGIAGIRVLEGKNLNAKRLIPIHDQLIALGFLEYVGLLRDAGYVKLFPHLKDGKNGYHKNFTRQFGTYLDKPEVNIVDPLKVFHSFRHMVITQLTNNGVNDGMKKAMVGHDVNTVETAHDKYIHPELLEMQALKKAISTLKYDGLDYAGLKMSQVDFLSAIKRHIAQDQSKKT